MDIYLVGGSIRDSILGIDSKDRDYVCPVDYRTMKLTLLDRGCTIIYEKPEFLTMKVKFPGSREVVDFTCCRAESEYDGRRPAFVEHSGLQEDLSRRDFTSGAIAQKVDPLTFQLVSEYIDPFDGLIDIEKRVLRFVGDPYARIREDELRWLRALRFQITKGFVPTKETEDALQSKETMSSIVSTERIREELHKCFKFDTIKTLEVLSKYPKIWHRPEIWFKPTTEEI